MGFFQELKEDLSQAVNELVPDDGVMEKTEPEMNEDAIFEAAEQSMGITYSTDVTDMIAASEELDRSSSYSYTESAAASEPEYTQSNEPEISADYVSDEVATITKMMTVNGDMISNGSLDVIGAINGNIVVKGKLNVTGNITGNSEASEIYAQDARIDGDMTSTGSIKIGSNTVVRGNIYATSAVIAGAVKGDIDVHGPVILDSTAIVMGNIKSKAVQINNGAAIEGMCSQCYADVSPSNFFRD